MDSPARSDSGLRGVLENPALTRLVAAFGAVNLAELTFITAFSIAAFRAGGTLAVGLIGLRLLVGALNSVTAAAALAHRRRILPLITQTRTVLLGTGALALLVGAPIGLVIALVCCDAAVAAPYRPAQSRLMPALAGTPEQISAGAAAISLIKALGQAGGGLAGGVIAELASPGWAMAGGAAVMALASVLTVGLDSPSRLAHQAQGERSVRPTRASVRSALRQATGSVAQVFADAQVVPVVLASGLRTLTRGLWSALLVVVALQLFDLGRSGVGALNAAAGVGALLALPVTAAMIGRARLAVPAALAFGGAGLGLTLAGALPRSEVLLLIVICGWGVAMAVSDSTSLSLLVRLLDVRTLTQTVGVMEALKLGLEGVGALLAPAVAALFGTRLALMLAGLPLPLLVLASVSQLRRADATAAGRGARVALLHGLRPLRDLDLVTLEELAARARQVTATAGTDVIRQGDPGDAYFAIADGEVEVVLDGFPIGRLGSGDGFGERALLRRSPRTATVRATTDVSLEVVDRSAFLAALTGIVDHSSALDNGREPAAGVDPDRPLPELLAEVTFLRGLSGTQLSRLAGAAKLESWPAGAVIVMTGEEPTAVYLLRRGRAEAQAPDGRASQLLPGDAFGEIGVLHGLPRTATVVATEPVSAWLIPAGPIREVLAGRPIATPSAPIELDAT